jgi:hypothetical protein
MRRRLLLAAIGLAIAGFAPMAAACPACVPAGGPTTAERLAAAEAALGGRQDAWLKGARERAQPTDDAQWRDLVAFHLGYLEHPEPAIAEIAYVEIARAPYEAMLAHRERLDATRIAGWLDDPSLAHRAPLYTLLLGIAGGSAATARVERSLAAAQHDRDVSNLAALLVAGMELHGALQVGWIEQIYLTDRSRSAQELQAVLVALQVQGGADAAIRRQRAVAAMRTFIRTRHPLAGYAAPVLMGWQAWDAVPDYVALLAAKPRQHPASTIAMLHYLERSERPEGRAAVAAYRASEARAQRTGSTPR